MRSRTLVGSFLSALALVACASVPGPTFEDEEQGEKSAALQQPSAAQAAAAPAGPRCGDRVCSADETCGLCPQDCGACKCVEAPACTNVNPNQAPTATPAPQLDVKFEAKSHARIAEQLREMIASGAPEARVLAAALASSSTLEQSPGVRRLREIFASHPTVASTLRAKLATVGMPSADQYVLRNPVEQGPRRGLTTMNGPVDCGPPQLVVRLAKITVEEEDDDFANDIVYCAITADSAKGSELRLSPRTPNLDEGESHTFAPGQTTVWGQRGPREAGGDLGLTYDCYEADTNDGYYAFLRVLASEGARSGDLVDESGWVSDTSGTVARLLPLVMALDTDDHLFEARQIIPLAEQLKLTRGGEWTVRKEGTHYASDWEWKLHMQAWGCAVNGGGTAAPGDAGPG